MPKSSYVKFFSELTRKDVHIAGGKGASLGEMTQAGIPVPPGFVLTAQAFDRFLHETALKEEIESQLNKVNYEDVNSVDQASNVIRDLIHDAQMPKDLIAEIFDAFVALRQKSKVKSQKLVVAVRSSATAEDSSQASWAGELDTFLNTTEKNLIGRVKECWSSLFTPRAIVYRNEKGMRKTHVSVAVVVQAMVQADISGVMFTVHPVTKDRNQLIIEAVWGLGEALVSGQLTPDSYVVDKRDWTLIDIHTADQERMIARKDKGFGVDWKKVRAAKQKKQKLDGKQIVELAKFGVKIEKHYKAPEDIEWVLAKKKFYIVQSRPITTL